MKAPLHYEYLSHNEVHFGLQRDSEGEGGERAGDPKELGVGRRGVTLAKMTSASERARHCKKAQNSAQRQHTSK